MSGVTIKHGNTTFATLTTTGSRTLKTAERYVPEDIVVEYDAPAPNLQSKTITVNGTYAAEDDGADGYDEVTVAVARADYYKQLVERTLTVCDLDGISTIGRSAFEGCTGITSVDLSGVASIGMQAFLGCTGLTAVDLSNVSSVAADAFYQCTGLTAIDLTGVTTVGARAFMYSGIKSAILSSSIYKLEEDMFARCTFDTPLIVPAGITRAAYYCFRWLTVPGITIENGAVNTRYMFSYGNSGDVYIDVTTTSEYLFAQATMSSLTFGPNVRTLSSNTFSDCYSAGTTIHLPATITSVATNALSGIPSSVTSLTVGEDWDCTLRIYNQFSVDVFRAIIANLKDNSATGVSRTLTIPAASMQLLSSNDISAATAKNWTVASA